MTPAPQPPNDGPLDLDLSQSFAQLDRAEQHLAALKTECDALMHADPFVVRCGDIDQQTGWASVYLSLKELQRPIVCSILGDLLLTFGARLTM